MITNCPVTGKRCYTKEEARAAIARMGLQSNGKVNRMYTCDWCLAKHIGRRR